MTMLLYILLLVRVLICTDIGGTDPDDNQSMMHYLLYSNRVACEGLVSSPSYGDGSKAEILRMIDLYEQDRPELCKHGKGWPSADYLRSITKQGRHGAAPMEGYSTATEGSNWIVQCARRKDKQPLYILVWGGLEDVAQALHDAPDIVNRIRIYWIGGPNKKWSLNSYSYIASTFPNLWFIENNASYRGFIADPKNPDPFNAGFYDAYVRGAGHLGEDFYAYKRGLPKLGDTPSLLYVLNGNPADPEGDSWGGSFERTNRSSRRVFDRPTTETDTIACNGIIEWHLRGPEPQSNESIPTTLTVLKQDWPVCYLGNGEYMARYSTYKTGVIDYSIHSTDPNFPTQSGQFYVENYYPGRPSATDYPLGDTWWTDRSDSALYATRSHCQGAATVLRHRKTVMLDWGKRCEWLRKTKDRQK